MDEVEKSAKLLEMVFRFRREVLEDRRSVPDELLVFWILRIEDAEGIFFKAPLAVLREFTVNGPEIFDESCPERGARHRVANRVEMDFYVF